MPERDSYDLHVLTAAILLAPVIQGTLGRLATNSCRDASWEAIAGAMVEEAAYAAARLMDECGRGPKEAPDA